MFQMQGASMNVNCIKSDQPYLVYNIKAITIRPLKSLIF